MLAPEPRTQHPSRRASRSHKPLRSSCRRLLCLWHPSGGTPYSPTSRKPASVPWPSTRNRLTVEVWSTAPSPVCSFPSAHACYTATRGDQVPPLYGTQQSPLKFCPFHLRTNNKFHEHRQSWDQVPEPSESPLPPPESSKKLHIDQRQRDVSLGNLRIKP